MKIITLGRTIVVPLSVVVVALAGLSAPTVAVRSVFILMAVAAIGLMLAVTRWGHRG